MAEETKERAKAATYFVLGKADDEDFAKAEHLAETLMSALPSGERPAPPPFPPAQPDSAPVCLLLGSDVPHPADATWGVARLV